MAKKKAKAVKATPAVPLVSECWTVPKAAEQLTIERGVTVSRSTLSDAIGRKAIPVHCTACGRELVLLSDCHEYLNNSPGRGFANPDIRAKAGKTRGERTASED